MSTPESNPAPPDGPHSTLARVLAEIDRHTARLADKERWEFLKAIFHAVLARIEPLDAEFADPIYDALSMMDAELRGEGAGEPEEMA